MSKPGEHTKNFSNFSLVGSATNFLGPLFAGISIDRSGHEIACLYVAALSLTAAILLLVWGKVLPSGHGRRAGPTKKMLEALQDREIWQMLAVSSLVQVGFDLFQFYMPIHGHALNMPASAIGAVLSTFAVASFVVRLAMPKLIERLGDQRLLEFSFYLGAASLLLIPFCSSAILLGAMSFIFGLGMGCGQPLTLMLMFSRSPEGRTGETLGLRLTVNNIMRVIGPAIFGILGSTFGLIVVFWANAVLLGSGGLLSRSRKSD